MTANEYSAVALQEEVASAVRQSQPLVALAGHAGAIKWRKIWGPGFFVHVHPQEERTRLVEGTTGPPCSELMGKFNIFKCLTAHASAPLFVILL